MNLLVHIYGLCYVFLGEVCVHGLIWVKIGFKERKVIPLLMHGGNFAGVKLVPSSHPTCITDDINT